MPLCSLLIIPTPMKITIKFPIYDYYFYVFIAPDFNAVKPKYIYFDLPKYGVGCSVGNKNENRAAIFLKPYYSIGTIVHECVHSIKRMFEYIGAENVDEEIYAYSLEYLVSEVTKGIVTCHSRKVHQKRLSRKTSAPNKTRAASTRKQ